MYDVFCYGAISLDISGKLEYSWPQSGQASATDYKMSVGGDAAIVSIMLAGLGLKVALGGGPVGDDAMGEHIRRILKSMGVDLIAPSMGKTSISFVIIDDIGRRSSLTFHENTPEEEIPVQEKEIKDSKYLYVDGCYGKNSGIAAGTARDTGIPTVLNLNVPSIPYMGLFNTVIACETVSGLFSLDPGEAAARIFDVNKDTAIVTVGEKGCFHCREKENVQNFPAFDVEPVDTTGAGAAFAAGFIKSRLSGRNFMDSIKFASAAGAYKCLSRGSYRIFSEADILEFIKNISSSHNFDIS
ncbi:carbohydrate kinase [Methanocella sp. CWC-04]|uniref:Carbohydrate kinase n=1 Tax=Methanooceanicella nereidis TaxID=2052831 RepID=A0AAP2RBP5_9EURY|nr:carbohydrate kinase family protein [Methanocella sp. CWC-04]MCD1293675.1 carbohydrate kinase [Methanocella sp. CWC-04]